MLIKKNSYKERVPQNILMRIPIRIRLLNQEKKVKPSTTIKATKPSITKVRIIYPDLAL